MVLVAQILEPAILSALIAILLRRGGARSGDRAGYRSWLLGGFGLLLVSGLLDLLGTLGSMPFSTPESSFWTPGFAALVALQLGAFALIAVGILRWMQSTDGPPVQVQRLARATPEEPPATAEGRWSPRAADARALDPAPEADDPEADDLPDDADSVIELRRTAAALKFSETCFRSIVEQSPNAGVISDFTGQIVYVNKSFMDFFVAPGDDPIGRNLGDLLPGELTSALEALTRKVIEGGGKIEREAEVEHVDGTTRLVRSTKFPVVGSDGRAMGLIQLITDITSEREVEQQLRQAQKLDAIGQLTGGIAHDFNNLLMVIDGYARQALQKLDDRAHAAASLKEVISGAERATSLTRQLLSFSRRQLLEKRVFAVNETLQELEGLLARSVGELFHLSFDLPERALCVETDSGEFSQAVINLAVNARDAMPQGGLITIGCSELGLDESFRAKYPDLTAARYLQVFVRDQGQGMDKETLARVFEPFFTTKERGKGTGLGLAMVYGFAQQSGGAVNIVSAPGEGTTVAILLPIADRMPDDTADEMDEAWLGKGETILLVEDDPKVLGLTRYCLDELGYQVLSAENGFDALEQDEAHEGEIDLVLSDVIMPVMGGLELADMMRERRPETKFVFMSGYPDRAQDRTDDPARTAQFLQKPLKMSRLAQAIRNTLDHDDNRLAR